jgi:hypothetical protein
MKINSTLRALLILTACVSTITHHCYLKFTLPNGIIVEKTDKYNCEIKVISGYVIFTYGPFRINMYNGDEKFNYISTNPPYDIVVFLNEHAEGYYEIIHEDYTHKILHKTVSIAKCPVILVNKGLEEGSNLVCFEGTGEFENMKNAIFKLALINDDYGHNFGDLIEKLEGIASKTRRATTSEDIPIFVTQPSSSSSSFELSESEPKDVDDAVVRLKSSSSRGNVVKMVGDIVRSISSRGKGISTQRTHSAKPISNSEPSPRTKKNKKLSRRKLKKRSKACSSKS